MSRLLKIKVMESWAAVANEQGTGHVTHRAVEGRCPPWTSRVRDGAWNTMEWPVAAGGRPPAGITCSQKPLPLWSRRNRKRPEEKRSC